MNFKRIILSILLLSSFSFVSAEVVTTKTTTTTITEETSFKSSSLESNELIENNAVVPSETIQAQDLKVRAPFEYDLSKTQTTNEPIKPDTVEDFAAAPFKLQSSTALIPVETRLRIKVETPLSAQNSEVGEDFKARVLNDFYLTGDFRKLIVPKDSWIRGKVSYIKKPRLLSRSGKLGIRLDTLVTPLGDYVPLDANLSFQQGVVNQIGLLDPQTGFSDKAMEPTNSLLSSNTGKAVSIATLGVPVVGTMIGGSAIALFSRGDAAAVTEGQELQIVLTQNTNLAN
jgi:hypothetical protein